AAIHHLRQLFLVPNLVREGAVRADRKNLHAELLEVLVPGGNCRQFGRSDEGEVPWVEAEHYPLPFVVGELDVLEAALHEGFGLEIRGLFAHLCRHFSYLLDWRSGNATSLAGRLHRRHCTARFDAFQPFVLTHACVSLPPSPRRIPSPPRLPG